jgi:DNA-binding NarL/FixJ family response regulator
MNLTIPGDMGSKGAIKKLLETVIGAKVLVSSSYATYPIMVDYDEYGFKAIVTKRYSVAEIEKTLQGLPGKRKW